MGDSGLVSSGGNGLAGLLYKNPQYTSAAIDPGTLDLMKNEADKASNNTANTYAQNDLAGISSGVDTTGAQSKAGALGGASDANMQAALQARSQRSMDAGLNQLQRQAQVMGTGQHAQQMEGAFKGVSGLEAQMRQATAAQIQARQNNQAARNSIISGLFGAAGTAAGFMGGGAGGGSAPQFGEQAAPPGGGSGYTATQDDWASFTGAPGG